VPDRFSGSWRIGDGRIIPIRRISERRGVTELRSLRGEACAKPALYFHATYFGGAHMAACTTGDGGVLRGRFDDNGIRGSLVQRKTGENRWVATVTGDGHAPFRIVGTRLR
jgi:hypothetical protein